MTWSVRCAVARFAAMRYNRRGFKVDEEAQEVTIRPKKEAPVTGGAASAENSKNTLVAEGQQGKPRERMLAELGLSAILPSTTTARIFVKATVGELDLTESVGVMREKARAVQAGNLAGLEAVHQFENINKGTDRKLSGRTPAATTRASVSIFYKLTRIEFNVQTTGFDKLTKRKCTFFW